jgi:sodium pump decarboxylase gamma subunit
MEICRFKTETSSGDGSMSPIVTSLWITLVGMGLVFIGLLLLWGLMELMVRFIKDGSPKEEKVVAKEAAEQEAAPQPVVAGSTVKARAAAAAVAAAIALAEQPKSVVEETVFEPPVPGITAWQAVLRAGQLNQRSHYSK